jgi:hypothetical protein
LGVMLMHTTYYGGALAPIPEDKASWNIWRVWTWIFLFTETSLPLWFAMGRLWLGTKDQQNSKLLCCWHQYYTLSVITQIHVFSHR